MTQLVIKFTDAASEEGCALCARPTAINVGPQLCLAESMAPVCFDCGQKHAPTLGALLDLARVAFRIGKISKHSPWVPLEKLLHLANAAEKFTDTTEGG